MWEDLKLLWGTRALRMPTIALFVSGFAFASTLPYLSLIGIKQLGLSEQQFGGVLLASALITTLGTVVISHFSDQAKNRKTAILVSYALGFIGFGAFSLFPTVWSYLAVLLLIAPLAQSATPQIFAVVRSITSQYGSTRAAAVNSLIRTIFAGSWIITPALSGAVIALTGRASDAYILGALAYGAALALYGALGPSGGRATPPEKGPIAGLLEAFRLVLSGHIVGRVAALAVIALAYPVNAALLPIFIVENLGQGTQEVGLIAGLTAALEIPAMLGVAFLVRRLSVVKVIALGGLTFAAYILALPLAGSMTWVYVLAAVNAMGAAALFTQHLSYLQDLMPDRPGLGSSLQSVEYLVMRGLGAAVVAGVGLVYGLEGAFVVTGIAGVAGVTALWLITARDR